MHDSSVLQVVIFREGSLVGTEVFMPGAYTLGSDEDCELLLVDASVAPCHAVLSFKEGRVRIEDLTGRGATVVNGAPVTATEVRARDDIAVGPFLVKVRVVGQKKPAAHPVPAPTPPKASPRAPAPARTPRADPFAAAMGTPFSEPPAEQATEVVRIPTGTAGPTPLPEVTPTFEELPAVTLGLERPGPGVVGAPVAGPRTLEELPVVGDDELISDTDAGLEREPAGFAAEPPPLEAPSARKAFAAHVSVEEMATAPGIEESRQEAARVAAARAAKVATRSAAPAPAGEAAGPFLRVKVVWGDSIVGLHGIAFGRAVHGGPSESCEVPLYHQAFGEVFELARPANGLWRVFVPRGVGALRQGPGGWAPVADRSVVLAAGEGLRLVTRGYAVELRPEPTPALEPVRFTEVVDLRVGLPFLAAASAVFAALLLMPEPPKEAPDFEPKNLAPIRALLKPPPKKKQEKIKEKLAQLTRKKVVEQDPDVVAPKTRAGSVKKAIKAVEKITSAGPAVESLLKATSKMAGGPKGYGDKGMGFKLSPLNGKPPIAMAGMEVGQGMGGFGAKTKGLGGVRGMGGGSGGGIGVFASGGTGKKKVAGTVVSAPARRAKVTGGSLPREAIAKVINEHLNEVRGCYERALLKSPGLAGKLLLEWTIDTTGRVSEIKVKTSTLRGPDVPNCIVGSLKTWVFPAPKGGRVIVSYPFLFNSVGF